MKQFTVIFNSWVYPIGNILISDLDVNRKIYYIAEDISIVKKKHPHADIIKEGFEGDPKPEEIITLMKDGTVHPNISI